MFLPLRGDEVSVSLFGPFSLILSVERKVEMKPFNEKEAGLHKERKSGREE